MNTTVIRKIGMNKGSPRIWLEGKLLDEAGFVAGALYDRSIQVDRVTLTLNPVGKFKVSGKAKGPHYTHPVIDLHCRSLGGFTQGRKNCVVTLKKGSIDIVRAEIIHHAEQENKHGVDSGAGLHDDGDEQAGEPAGHVPRPEVRRHVPATTQR